MILKKALPFSESFEEYNQNGNSAIIFGLMLIVALLAGLHFTSTLLPYGIYLYLGIAITCCVFFGSWLSILVGNRLLNKLLKNFKGMSS